MTKLPTGPDLFQQVCKAKGLPVPVTEFVFARPRKFRFDYAWIDAKVALECDGGVWIKGGGRHNRGKGFLTDMTKMNLAAVLGWRVLRCTPDTLLTAETLDMIRLTLDCAVKHSENP